MDLDYNVRNISCCICVPFLIIIIQVRWCGKWSKCFWLREQPYKS